MDSNDKKIIHYEKHLCVKDSLINLIPTIFMLSVVILCLVVGLNYLHTIFVHSPIYPIMVILWLIIIIPLTYRIPIPHAIYNVEKGYYEDENE